MIRQATIYFKDGTQDWIDPYEDFYIADNKIFIRSVYVYDYNLKDVDYVEINDIESSKNNEVIWRNKI